MSATTTVLEITAYEVISLGRYLSDLGKVTGVAQEGPAAHPSALAAQLIGATREDCLKQMAARNATFICFDIPEEYGTEVKIFTISARIFSLTEAGRSFFQQEKKQMEQEWQWANIGLHYYGGVGGLMEMDEEVFQEAQAKQLARQRLPARIRRVNQLLGLPLEDGMEEVKA